MSSMASSRADDSFSTAAYAPPSNYSYQPTPTSGPSFPPPMQPGQGPLGNGLIKYDNVPYAGTNFPPPMQPGQGPFASGKINDIPYCGTTTSMPPPMQPGQGPFSGGQLNFDNIPYASPPGQQKQ